MTLILALPFDPKISGRCYSLMRKNGEWIVVDVACVKSRRVSILYNLTDMRQTIGQPWSTHGYGA
jgi:hypothetical protein